jgi:hypothetical protein
MMSQTTMSLPQAASSSFTYTSTPHSAPRAGAYRNTNAETVPLTMMSDPRVIRGNTHALTRKIAKERTAAAALAAYQGAMPGSKRAPETYQSLIHPPNTQAYYSFASKPFSSEATDLSSYLVDARDEEVVQLNDISTQADRFAPLLTRQPYIPRKTGIDSTTQVEDVAELFDFDVEVTPMLEVILHKTLEQALVEVNHEEELVDLQEQLAHYENLQLSEANWAKEHEDRIKTEQEKMHMHMQSMREQLQRQREVKKRIAALQLTRQILPDALETIIQQNIKKKIWRPLERALVEEEVLPELLRDCNRRVNSNMVASQVLDELLLSAENKFDGISLTASPASSLQLHLQLLRRGEDTATEEGETVPGKIDILFKLSMLINETDSILSLEKRILVSYIAKLFIHMICSF